MPPDPVHPPAHPARTGAAPRPGCRAAAALRRLLGPARLAALFYELAGHAAFIGVLLSVGALFGTRHWALDLLVHMQPLLAASFVLYAGIERLRRRPARFWCSLAFALLNIRPVCLALFTKNPACAASPDFDPVRTETLRILQANVLTCNRRHAGLLALIRKEKPDVILLQETDRAWLEALAPIHPDYPFRRARPLGHNVGIAVYAKNPRADAEVFLLPDTARNPGIRLTLPVAGGALTFFNIHAPSPYTEARWEARNAFTRKLAEKAAAAPGPKIVAGDFNNTPWNPFFREFLRSAGLCRPSLWKGGFLPTWPTSDPPPLRIPLDHCLHSPGVRVLRRRRGPEIGSDHFPVITDVLVCPPRRQRPRTAAGP